MWSTMKSNMSTMLIKMVTEFLIATMVPIVLYSSLKNS
uniref:Uncharacterized protein n=1 Tax=Ascaris lumbricoides TaxID=6252 RepID=A0A0M3HIK8_ASCLU